LDTASRASLFDAMSSADVATLEQLKKLPFVETRDSRSLGSTLEVLAAAYAFENETEKFEETMIELDNTKSRVSAKCLSKVLRSHLQHGKALCATKVAKQMIASKYNVAPFLMTDVYRCLIKKGYAIDLLDVTLPELTPTSHSALLILEDYGAKAAKASAKEELAEVAAATKKLMNLVRNNSDTPARAHVLCAQVLMQAGDASGAMDELDLIRSPLSEPHVLQLLSKCEELGLVQVAECIAQHKKVRITHHVEEALNKVYLSKDSVGGRSGPLGKSLSAKSTDTSDDETRDKDSDAVHAIRLCTDPRKVLQLIQKSIDAGKKDSVIFNAALDVCATAGDIQKVRTILTLAEKECSPTIITYNTALKVFAVKSDLQGAKAVLASMTANAVVPPNEISYNILLNIAVGSAPFAECWRLVEDMKRKGLRVDHYTISTLLKSAKKQGTTSGQVNQPLEAVLGLMDSLQIEPSSDEVMLSSVLDLCMVHNKTDRIKQILVKAPFTHLTPTKQSFGVMLQAAAEVGDVEKSLAIWLHMTSDCKFEPSRLALESMLNVLAKAGCVSIAVELLEKWKARLAPTAHTYKVLLSGLEISSGKSSVELLKDLRKAGLKTKTLLYNIVLESEAKQNKSGDIEEIFKLMEEDGCQPDTFTSALQIKALCNCGKLKAAFQAFEVASQTNGKVDTVAFNTLLDGCIRMSENKLADKLIEMMDTCGVVPSNFTLGTVIKLYGKRQQLDKCFEACDLFKRKYGIAIDNTIKNCVMSACILNQSVDMATSLLKSMQEDGVRLEARTLFSIIGLCRRKECFEQALKVCQDIVNNRAAGMSSVDPHELTALATAMDKAGRFEELMPTYRRLRDQGIPLASWIERRLY